MKWELVSRQFKLLAFAIILLLLRVNFYAVGQFTTAAALTDGEINSTNVSTSGEKELSITSTNGEGDSELTTTTIGPPTMTAMLTTGNGDVTRDGARTEAMTELPINQQDDHTPILHGITLTAVIVVSVLGGLTCLTSCIIVSLLIAVKVKHKKRNRSRQREASATTVRAANVQQPEFVMTDNNAYRSGQQGRANMNLYSARPSSRAETGHTNMPETAAPPNSYVQSPYNRIDVSMDSQGYVKLPRPHT